MNIDKALNIDGWMNEPHLWWLAEQASKANRIIELGSWKGRSTRALADNTPGEVWAIDTWAGSPNEIDAAHAEIKQLGPDGLFNIFWENLKDLMGTKVHPLRMTGDEAYEYLIKEFGAQSFDMVFIDADHLYESVTNDVLRYAHFVRSGGILCGHDYDWPEVARAVQDSLSGFTVVDGSLWQKIM